MLPLRFICCLLLFYLTKSDENCKLNSQSSCSLDRDGRRYKRDENWGNYLKEINTSLENYKPCEYRNCSCFLNFIDSDLNPWQNGISRKSIEESKQFGTFYQIINHKLYRQKECLFPFRCSGIEYFILQIINELPNVEFVLNTRDWPQSPKQWKKLPILSFSKTNEYWDILYPAWSFWEGGPAISLYPTGLGRWDEHRKSIPKSAKKWPWKKKIAKAFFRGSRTNAERDSLILLSRANPILVDAKYTKNQAWKSDADTLYEKPANEISLEDHCQYKYLFNFRGVAASFRFKHLFLCKSLVFHVGDEWNEFFYPLLKPWVHYIPVKSDHKSTDLESLLEFAIANEEISEKIAENGFNVIWDQLTLNNVKCYWNQLLTRFSKLQNDQIIKDENLEEIKR